MARLIPHANPAQIDLDPERRVAEALCAQLPPKALVFHSYPWLRPDRDHLDPHSQPVLKEGEADFVVVHPRYGVMVVEVKGGHLHYDPAAQRWTRQGSRHDVKDPFDQAARNLHALEAILQQRGFGRSEFLPFSRARCVVFPHCNYSGSTPPGAHRSMLFGASDLASLGAKIEALFELQPFIPAAALSNSILDGIVQGLTSTFQLVPALWSEIQDQEKRLLRFTEDQLNILTVLQSYPRAAIQGVAGSGKTLLAVAKARAFADEGKRVLFLCFNELLAEWVRDDLPSTYDGRLIIRNYHKLCSEWTRAAGLHWPHAGDDLEFFKERAPKLLEDAIELRPDLNFDAVVVDEGQDFLPAWWDTVELINKRPTEGPLYIFFDPEQQIFHERPPTMPDLGRPFVLPVNCRNTEQIARQCGRIIGKEIAVNKGTPAGTPPRQIEAPSRDRQKSEVEKQIEEWMHPTTGLKANQIAIITRGKVEKSSLAGLDCISGHALTHRLREWRNGVGILITNLHRFKGLEADALILVDFVRPGSPQTFPGFSPEHFYVACSRAKHLLTILTL